MEKYQYSIYNVSTHRLNVLVYNLKSWYQQPCFVSSEYRNVYLIPPFGGSTVAEMGRNCRKCKLCSAQFPSRNGLNKHVASGDCQVNGKAILFFSISSTVCADMLTMDTVLKEILHTGDTKSLETWLLQMVKTIPQ